MGAVSDRNVGDTLLWGEVGSTRVGTVSILTEIFLAILSFPQANSVIKLRLDRQPGHPHRSRFIAHHPN